jgi:hypothetical protein
MNGFHRMQKVNEKVLKQNKQTQQYIKKILTKIKIKKRTCLTVAFLFATVQSSNFLIHV